MNSTQSRNTKGWRNGFEAMQHFGVRSIDEALAELTAQELDDTIAAACAITCEVPALLQYLSKLLAGERARRVGDLGSPCSRAADELCNLLESDDLYCEDAQEPLWQMAAKAVPSMRAYNLVASIFILGSELLQEAHADAH